MQCRAAGGLRLARLVVTPDWDVALRCSCNGSIKLYSANFSILLEQVLGKETLLKGHVREDMKFEH